MGGLENCPSLGSETGSAGILQALGRGECCRQLEVNPSGPAWLLSTPRGLEHGQLIPFCAQEPVRAEGGIIPPWVHSRDFKFSSAAGTPAAAHTGTGAVPPPRSPLSWPVVTVGRQEPGTQGVPTATNYGTRCQSTISGGSSWNRESLTVSVRGAHMPSSRCLAEGDTVTQASPQVRPPQTSGLPGKGW